MEQFLKPSKIDCPSVSHAKNDR